MRLPARRPLVARIALLAAVLTLGACGSTDEGSPATTEAGCVTAEAGRLTLVADDVRWNTACLRAEPGPLTIEVDNQDEGISHNVHLPDAPGSPASDLEVGPSRQELGVTLGEGSYEFICDLHPNMVGTLTVERANQP